MKSFYRVTWVLALAVCAPPVVAQTQTQDEASPTQSLTAITTETPESVAARYMQAVQRGDWKASAALMHPDALQQLKRMFRPIVFALTAPGLDVGKTFFGVRTPAEFDRLSGALAYERLMGTVTKLNPEVGSALATSKSQIIGHVLEAPDTAQVVYRMTAKTQGISVTKVAVMSLKQVGATWGGLLTGDIEGMAAALSRATAVRSAPKPQAAKKPTAKPQRR
jgi:hypothetical protein